MNDLHPVDPFTKTFGGARGRTAQALIAELQTELKALRGAYEKLRERYAESIVGATYAREECYRPLMRTADFYLELRKTPYASPAHIRRLARDYSVSCEFVHYTGGFLLGVSSDLDGEPTYELAIIDSPPSGYQLYWRHFPELEPAAVR